MLSCFYPSEPQGVLESNGGAKKLIIDEYYNQALTLLSYEFLHTAFHRPYKCFQNGDE